MKIQLTRWMWVFVGLAIAIAIVNGVLWWNSFTGVFFDETLGDLITRQDWPRQ